MNAELQGKSNSAQEAGSGLTYARRYSLLLALGLATDDDDAEIMTRPKKVEPAKGNIDFTEVRKKIKEAKNKEELTDIWNGIPEKLRQYFLEDFQKQGAKFGGEK